MACFVLELLATVYKRIPENKRPRLQRVIVASILSAIVTAVGAYIGPKIPSEFYFVCARIIHFNRYGLCMVCRQA